jgi:enterochelin esterase family protein
MKLSAALLCGALSLSLCVLPLSAQNEEPLSPRTLQSTLKNVNDANADQIAERLRGWFGKEDLARGAKTKIDGLDVAWAIESTSYGAPVVVARDGAWRLPLQRVGKSNLWAAATSLSDGTGLRWHYEVEGKALNNGQLEVYNTHPDAVEKPGIPRGKLTQQATWKSNIFADTERNWWIYVPAQYKAGTPACVMVFQDGGGAKNYIPTAFDNLIADGSMPVTVAIFLDPGKKPGDKSNRSFEYDTLSDQYARFLLEEILPEVEKTVNLREDAPSRAIAGNSSGGICAWTVAWQRPEEFNKVMSWIGSFTNIASGPTLQEGGHNYPALIRKTPKKPIRVFLQDGENDLDNVHGNWPLANQQMAKALAFAGYDHKFVWGQGFHSDRHGRAILPDALRWLWRDWKEQKLTAP